MPARTLSDETRRTLDSTLRGLTRLMKADGASVYRASSGFLRQIACCGIVPKKAPDFPIASAPFAQSLASGKPLLVSSFAAETDETVSDISRRRARTLRIQAFAAIPLRMGGRLGGSLSVAFAKPRTLSRAEVGTLTIVAHQIAAVLQSAELLEETRAFADVASIVTSSLDLRTVLRRIADNAQRIVASTHASVLLLQPDGELHGAAATGKWDRPFRKIRIAAGETTLATAALAARKTIVIEDARTDRRVSPRLLRTFGTRGIVCTPLIARDRVVGVLTIVEATGPRRFDVAEIERIETLANQAASAIERAATHASLLEHERELRILSERLVTAHEAERRRISRELHDVVGQALAAATLEVARVERITPGGARLLAPARRILRETANATRRLSAELHPGIVDDLGLASALRWYCTEFERRSGISVTFGAPIETPIPDDAAFVLYRAAQEGLANILRHSGAKRAWLELRASARTLSLELDDDGSGPAKGRPRRPGVGLLAIRERAANLGGAASLQRSPRGGARLIVELPAVFSRPKATRPRKRESSWAG